MRIGLPRWRSGWASATTCWADTRGRSKRCAARTGVRWPTSTWASRQFAIGEYADAIACYRGGQGAGYNADQLCARSRQKLSAIMGDAAAGAGHARSAVRRGRADGRVPVSARRRRWRPSAAIRRKWSRCTNGPSKPIRRHSRALFGLALENDRRGNDDEALELYERAVAAYPDPRRLAAEPGGPVRRPPAVRSAQAVLSADPGRLPDHPRARLYLKDAAASGDMFYDEEAQKRTDRLLRC